MRQPEFMSGPCWADAWGSLDEGLLIPDLLKEPGHSGLQGAKGVPAHRAAHSEVAGVDGRALDP